MALVNVSCTGEEDEVKLESEQSSGPRNVARHDTKHVAQAWRFPEALQEPLFACNL